MNYELSRNTCRASTYRKEADDTARISGILSPSSQSKRCTQEPVPRLLCASKASCCAQKRIKPWPPKHSSNNASESRYREQQPFHHQKTASWLVQGDPFCHRALSAPAHKCVLSNLTRWSLDGDETVSAFSCGRYDCSNPHE